MTDFGSASSPCLIQQFYFSRFFDVFEIWLIEQSMSESISLGTPTQLFLQSSWPVLGTLKSSKLDSQQRHCYRSFQSLRSLQVYPIYAFYTFQPEPAKMYTELVCNY